MIASMEQPNANAAALPSSIDVHSISFSALATKNTTQDVAPTTTNDGITSDLRQKSTTKTTPKMPPPFGSPTMSMLSSVVSYDEEDHRGLTNDPSPSPMPSVAHDSHTTNSSSYHSCHSVPQTPAAAATTTTMNTGWERTQSLLSERNKMQRKLQKALVGCAKESKRLDQMEVSLRSFEAKEQGDIIDRGNLVRGASKDTSTTCSQSSGDDGSASHSSRGSSNSSGSSGRGAGANDSTIVSYESSDDEEAEEEDAPSQQHLENCYLPTKYDGLSRSAPSPGPVVTGRSWSMIYEDMRRLSAQCSTMQRLLDVKDKHIEQLYKDNQAIIRRFERAKENHRKIQKKYESLIKRMCAKQCEELSIKDKTIEEQRNHIQHRDDVIQKLLDANKKLEVALGAMTKVANNAVKEKNRVREDLKLLRSSHLKDIMNRTTEKNKNMRRE